MDGKMMFQGEEITPKMIADFIANMSIKDFDETMKIYEEKYADS